MDRDERGPIDYRVLHTDGDPLAAFADESAQTTEPERSTPVQTASTLPAYPVNSAGRASKQPKWVAAGLVSVAFAALGAGAFVYVNYPRWSASAAAGTTATRGDGSRPTATNDQAATSGTASDASRPSPAARNSSEPDAPRTQGSTAEATDSDFGPLTGQWAMNTRVESSGLRRYEGLRFEYQLRLQQVGDQVTGEGYKLRENNRAVGTKTPITLIGDVIGDRVVLNFQERGTRRMSEGRLVLDRESENLLRGRFSSDAAKSRGVADVHR